MSRDKSWMQLQDRRLPEYKRGVDEFLTFAYQQHEVNETIRCPCTRCLNYFFYKKGDVKLHLLAYGIDNDYSFWHHHGEEDMNEVSSGDDSSNGSPRHHISQLVNDLLMATNKRDGECGIDLEGDGRNDSHGNADADVNDESNAENPNEYAESIYRMMEECEQPLYAGCENFSKLSFLVRLLNFKCLSGTSDTGFTMLLALLLEAFPDAKIPPSYYEAKKTIKDLGLHYEKIDACENDCVLFRKEYAHLDKCPICKASRWVNDEDDGNVRSSRKRIPKKVLRHFPLAPRLQRFYLNSNTAKSMRWHKEERVQDGLLRHPADSLAWKSFDEIHPDFDADPRNVRLALASDGFNPFGILSSTYSVWHVILVPYNMPPWMCLKSPYFMMSLLIPGPHEPGNDIDVYLQPLIDELNELWETGVETYHAFGKQNFQLRAALLWTINDFPAYGYLSGWSTKGAMACPSCHQHTFSQRLKNECKMCFMGHRRSLPLNHRWRKEKKMFNGKQEKGLAPKGLSGDEVLQQLGRYDQVVFGKDKERFKKRKRQQKKIFLHNWKKRSIFFTLPYWKSLLLRHNLDLMHIEKNICDSILGTLLGTDKTKDNLNARLDMESMKIHEELWPERDEEGNVKSIPAACYTFSREEKTKFCQFLVDLKVPDGYASNISRCVVLSECKLTNLKSHDLHVILHRHLPLAIRGLLNKEVCEILIELSTFYRQLCSKVLDPNDLDLLEKQIVITLCKMERIFPPAFFDVMVHLSIHLANEAKLGGPVQYRWMYIIERYLKTIKSYVRNKARPEGSIAEGYIAQECLNFCSLYLRGVDTRLNRVGINHEDTSSEPTSDLAIFLPNGFHLKNPIHDVLLDPEEFTQARDYVLRNCDEVLPFLGQYMAEVTGRSEGGFVHDEENFPIWFREKVARLYTQGDNSACKQLLHLAEGPYKRITRYNGYVINGFRFCPMPYEEEKKMKTQNSGVMVKGDEATGFREYFGYITDIIELTYNGDNKVVLFKCHWWDMYNEGRGYKEDEYGFISVNTTRALATKEPYVLASQVEQVYYTRDQKDSKWNVVVKTRPKDLFDILESAKNTQGEDDPTTINEPVQESEQIGRCNTSLDNDHDSESFTLRRDSEFNDDHPTLA